MVVKILLMKLSAISKQTSFSKIMKSRPLLTEFLFTSLCTSLNALRNSRSVHRKHKL
ncbi:hypothetical protein HOLleu_45007 [Holothuria leucospilota]|uniref:Uncharacterized protein n=1 Tax=Holothuria leucospilota TaxID=206669 RepID=A0A9Q1B9X6_HOLLE|nr:hypothetical protein HOLleu_45007 [Holothuria leucospilota]